MRFRVNLKQVRLILVVAGFMILAGLVGFQLGSRRFSVPTGFRARGVEMDLFWDVWDLLDERYLDKEGIDPERAVYGAIAGMVASLEDPHTAFLNPVQNERMEEEMMGSFGGIGIFMDYFDEGVIGVVAPLSGYPAESAGILAGDLILAVDGQSLLGSDLYEAVNLIRGPVGSEVKLTVMHEDGFEEVVAVTRDLIDIPSVEVEFEDQVAVLTLSRFGDQTRDEWLAAVDQVVVECGLTDCLGLVLDLRNNPGGYLQDSLFITSEFLTEGVVFIQEDPGEVKTPYEVNRVGQLTDLPLVVLVNRGSASASEIVAGALDYHQRAVLVGETTFGKGTIQEPIELSGGAGLHVTVARWLLPDEGSVDRVGLTPDFELVEDQPERDLSLEKAISILKEEGQ